MNVSAQLVAGVDLIVIGRYSEFLTGGVCISVIFCEVWNAKSPKARIPTRTKTT